MYATATLMSTMLVTTLTPVARDEAEEADHERHRKKMERVAERRKANWEKKAKVSWECLCFLPESVKLTPGGLEV